jgi:hypothetical protein
MTAVAINSPYPVIRDVHHDTAAIRAVEKM